MNTSAVQYSSEPCWSRRNSIESILSIQGKETDFVCDSSDTELCSDDIRDWEYEPCSEPDDEGPIQQTDSSGESDGQIIKTEVIKVTVCDEGDLEFADSEQTESDAIDSEVDLCDYWKCVQCGSSNNNPLYRYCEKCFKVRKNFFPPRPKRKHKREVKKREETRALKQESGIDGQRKDHLPPITQPPEKQINTKSPANSKDIKLHLSDRVQSLSQEDKLSQDSGFDSQEISPSQCSSEPVYPTPSSSQPLVTLKNDYKLNAKINLKRRAESADRNAKRARTAPDNDSDSNSDIDTTDVTPLSKTISDPSLTVEDVKVTKKVISDAVKEIDDNKMCIICLSEPKSGVFVHGRIAHICCCYRCAVKVWAKAKRCPVCNCKVSNVLRAVVM